MIFRESKTVSMLLKHFNNMIHLCKHFLFHPWWGTTTWAKNIFGLNLQCRNKKGMMTTERCLRTTSGDGTVKESRRHELASLLKTTFLPSLTLQRLDTVPHLPLPPTFHAIERLECWGELKRRFLGLSWAAVIKWTIEIFANMTRTRRGETFHMISFEFLVWHRLTGHFVYPLNECLLR